jgi:Cft2 family RNA processing exonuclease
MLSIRFLGAAQTVTGSCFLVENDSQRVLVDCGLVQGQTELTAEIAFHLSSIRRRWTPSS